MLNMRILLWHVHGSWTTSFVQGDHDYLLPVTPDRDSDGLGRARTWDWPSTVVEVPHDRLHDTDVDLVVLQRPHELELAERWTGRRPGRDVPAVYVEHNTPRPYAVDSRHPVADRDDIPIVHVTEFNRLMWDNGIAPTTVITHGLRDPGHLYTGEIASAATMINEPVRRWRTVGADLLAPLARHVPIDVWGIDSELLNEPTHRTPGVTPHGDVPTDRLMPEVARRRVHLHTARWTSLGLSLIEAMFLGMPVVAVASTMAPLVIPAEAGVVSADVSVLGTAAAEFVADPAAALAAGKAARDYATTHFGLGRFLAEWSRLIEETCT
jgi:glycosyltransferase involved in cell wall biosynthesis